MTNAPTPSTETDDRLGWRIAEFCKLIGMNRATISKMAKLGQLNLIYFGDVPIVPRAEAIRLGLINA
jgi:hypothetical protein